MRTSRITESAVGAEGASDTWGAGDPERPGSLGAADVTASDPRIRPDVSEGGSRSGSRSGGRSGGSASAESAADSGTLGARADSARTLPDEDAGGADTAAGSAGTAAGGAGGVGGAGGATGARSVSSEDASHPGGPHPPPGHGGRDTRSDALVAAVLADESARTRKPAAAPRPPPGPRRGPADPVKALMHRHRELCERAVDPLEIAAGLEAHGVTDRTAARFRHRDVFSLAEELYARVPRGAESPQTADNPARAAGARAARSPEATGRLLLTLLPGAACALAVVGMEATEGGARIAAAATGATAVAAALTLCLRRGPLRAEGRTVPALRLWTLWLLAHVAFGEGLLNGLVAGGPDGALLMTPAPFVGLALAVAPAAWCARFFSVRARRRLDGSRGLEEFASGARPLLFGAVALYVCALAALLVLVGLALPHEGLVPAAALGTLLFLARLLIVHGFSHSAAVGLGTACAAEILAPVLLLAGRLPGCGFLARPVEAAVGAWGAGAVPAVACGAAALGLLAHATAALSRASAHTV
ncbi:hypothetical protein [Streptomyces sp. NBC_00829]|uniref:hypothetical protein n=1 Tax=Streptomyces sp. NBC_00829 TaxID=2903679 RepID=UPI0038632121|nr:hypothetical protein OG293_11330 [Streptomyces sp. NBC_00829]